MLAYRSDIDGLRAVAVGAVVLYHADLAGFSGGFVGVDVFFVISGYLITAILRQDLERGRFSIATFYERRIRRIFPALFVMLAATGGAASIILLPHEMADFGRSLIAATMFVSNVFFHQTADYFAGPAHLKPLLHTWSLSVEEQFYVVFPLAMWGIAKWGRGRWGLFLWPVLVASFALAAWGAHARPQGTFYLAPMRAWELLIGAVLATGCVPAIRTRWIAQAMGAAGIAMIALPVMLYSEATVFPGAGALLPCLGAAALIHSGGAAATWTSRLLSLGPMVRLGLVSYSLYLWHWPVLVLARIEAGGQLTAQAAAVAVGVSLALAFLSWRYVEGPFRGKGTVGSRRRVFAGAALAMTAAISCGAAAHVSGGWPGRFPDYARPEIAGKAHMNEGTCFLRSDQLSSDYGGVERCTFGRGATKVVVWGDSFAAHLVPGLQAAAAEAMEVVQITASACPPVIGFKPVSRPACAAFNDAAVAAIERTRPDVVVLSGRWELYPGQRLSLDLLQATLDRVGRTGAKVLVVGHAPTFDFDHPYDAVYRSGRATAAANGPSRSVLPLGLIAGASVIDPMAVLCAARECPLKDDAGWRYFDGGHLSVAGSRLMATALGPRIGMLARERTGRLATAAGR